ncbi:MAG: hypothetical protein LLF96_06795 [Eubacteriales bacterium]|nr:hypothetical protein [Eubacteriales bacterium]
MKTMNTLKHKNAMRAYVGFAGPRTVAAIMERIPETLLSGLTGAQIGMVMNAVNDSYQAGRTSAGAEVIDGEYVWVDCLQRGFDLSELRALPE